jgi:hypothetical protein
MTTAGRRSIGSRSTDRLRPMLIEDDQPAPPVDDRRSRPRRVLVGAMVFLVTAFIALTARLFVWPTAGSRMPMRLQRRG